MIAAARARGIAVIGELELAWRLLPNEFVAVTGTNGKTTTVELIGAIYRAAGLPVVVAGNVGLALSRLASAPPHGDGRSTPATTIVCEASSFQLEDAVAFAPAGGGAAQSRARPPRPPRRHGRATSPRSCAVFAHQGADDLAVVPVDGPAGGRARAARMHLRRGRGADLRLDGDCAVVARRAAASAARAMRLRGAHNRENAMAAAAVTLARGVPREAVRRGARDVPPASPTASRRSRASRRALRQRLQGDERREHARRAARVRAGDACT